MHFLVHARLAALYAALGEPDRALALALELPADEPNLLYQVGKALLNAGCLSQLRALLPRLCETATGALRALELLIRAYPDSAEEIILVMLSGD